MPRHVRFASLGICTAALAASTLLASCVKQSAPCSEPAATPVPAAPPAATATAAVAAPAATPEPAKPATLRAAAAPTGRKIGVALATWFFEQPGYQEIAAAQFDSLTPENEMKWYEVEPQPGVFNFKGGDKLVDFAEKHGMRMRGHTLVWHNQLAPWVKTLKGEALRKAMLNHATKTVEHWKGRIQHWDVVNEAVDETGKLRANSVFTQLGPTYIDEAFRAAHAADPKALLFYNDYDIEDADWPKSEGAYQLVKRLKESGVPIHGMGFQMHVDPRKWPPPEKLKKALERFAALDLLIELTEIDVPVGEIPGDDKQKLEKQAEWMRGITRICLEVPKCSGLTLWGLSDKQSWLSTKEWEHHRGKGPHRALPFDENHQPKPMFHAFLEALNQGAPQTKL
jgi:endo-1,4-beta-xylanase